MKLQFRLLLLGILQMSYAIAQICLSPDASAAPPDIAEIHPNLYRGQQQFTVTMLEAIRKATPNENIFFSPYSTYHALLLAYFGSAGQTQKELVDALHLNWAKSKADVRSGYRLEKQRRAMRSRHMPLEFSSADRIFFDSHIHLASCLQTVLEEELSSLNFREDPETGRQQINNWIANITRNEIPDMLAPGDIDASTNLVLANAAYFKGQWSSKFEPDHTKMEVFYSSPSNVSFVQMMHIKGNFLFTVEERIGAHVLQLPYRTSHNDEADSDIVMVVVLPPFLENALEQVLSKLQPDTFKDALEDSMPREIEVALPKFEFEQRLELVPILRQMGINDIFDHNANFTDFSTTEAFNFGDAKHVAKIKVDEEGSTAAAATVLVSFRSARPSEPTKFICNHPFLFMIYDKRANAILFTGIYRDPKTIK